MSTTSDRDEIDALRQRAADLFANGQSRQAAELQIKVVKAAISANDGDSFPLDDYNRLGMYSYYAGNYQEAANVFLFAHNRHPDSVPLLVNLGNALIRLGEHEKAGEALMLARARRPDDFDICDSLAMLCGKLGDRTAARDFGERALTLKDKLATKGRTFPSLPNDPPPAFDPNEPSENVVSFSLWGDGADYTEGALENARQAASIFPGWTCRFHVDETVPETTLQELAGLGADVQMMPPRQNVFEGLFWRFSVADAAKIKRFLIRDCDSVFNVREAAAVDPWLNSDRYFHLMRDYFTHTELILAGLWGGVGGVLPPMADLKRVFFQKGTVQRTTDQVFLRQQVWPIIKTSCLIHDSQFSCFDAVDFPAHASLPAGRHVGENAIKARELGRR